MPGRFNIGSGPLVVIDESNHFVILMILTKIANPLKSDKLIARNLGGEVGTRSYNGSKLT